MNDMAKLAADILSRYEFQRSAISDAARALMDFERSRKVAIDAVAKPLEDHQRMIDLANMALPEPMKMLDADKQAALAMAKMTELEGHALWHRLR